MFKQSSFVGPNSMLASELKASTVNLFNIVPERSQDRNRAKIYERYRRKIKSRIMKRSEELIDALTDLVKDYPTEEDIKKAGDLLKQVLEAKDEKDLAESIANLEHSLTKSEKNAVLRDELSQLRDTVKKGLKGLMEFNWSEVEEPEAEKFYFLSQILSMINSIAHALLVEIRMNTEADIKNGVAALFYLTLRTIAYLMEKIQKESLETTISAVQAFVYSHATYLLAN